MLIHCQFHDWACFALITQCARWRSLLLAIANSCLCVIETSSKFCTSSNALFQSQPSFAPIIESVVIATVKYYQMNYSQQEQTKEQFLLSAKITYQVLLNIP